MVTAHSRTVSVVIPCYRSETTLPRLIDRLLPVLAAHTSSYEVILVVDGSPDLTWEVARQLADDTESITAMRLSRNYGQHNALLAGVRAARFDMIVTMDDDLQHRPEQIPLLLDGLSPGVDLVYGVPGTENHGVARNIASRSVKSFMARALRIPSAGDISAFRAFRTRLRDGFAAMAGPYVSMDVALSWTTTRIEAVTVTVDARAAGESGYTTRMLIRHAANMVLGYSSAPLRMVSYVGLLCAALGTALFAYVLWSFFSGSTTVQGFTTLASMIAIFSGAQLLALGVVGEYLARVHLRSMGRPTYVVVERTSHSVEDDRS